MGGQPIFELGHIFCSFSRKIGSGHGNALWEKQGFHLILSQPSHQVHRIILGDEFAVSPHHRQEIIAEVPGVVSTVMKWAPEPELLAKPQADTSTKYPVEEDQYNP